jgi:hypothetical protein
LSGDSIDFVNSTSAGYLKTGTTNATSTALQVLGNDVSVQGCLTVTGKSYALSEDYMNANISLSGNTITLKAGSELMACGKYQSFAVDTSITCAVFGALSQSTYLWVNTLTQTGSMSAGQLTTSGANFVPQQPTQAYHYWYNPGANPGTMRCIGAFNTLTASTLDKQNVVYYGNRCIVWHTYPIYNAYGQSPTTSAAPNRFATSSSTPVMAKNWIGTLQSSRSSDVANAAIVAADIASVGTSILPFGTRVHGYSNATLTSSVPLGPTRDVLIQSGSSDTAGSFYAYQTGYECKF